MISVLTAFRAGDPHREAAWRFVQSRWLALYPEVELVISDDLQDPFSRAASLNRAAEVASGDVLVIADTDVLLGPYQLELAVEWATDPGLVVGFSRYLALTQAATDRVLEQPVETWPELEPRDLDWMTTGSVGPFVVLSRKTWETVGGFDPRFRGWGFEDVAFACAARALVCWERRVPGELLHLWHPSAWNTEAPTYAPNLALEQRYEAADADGVRALQTEWQT